MFETSSLQISKEAYRHNLKFIKQQIGASVRFCSVVKGNAYGHGIASFVKMAIEEGVDYFAVYSADEAYQIKQNCDPKIQIMIMGMIGEDALEWVIKNGIEFFVFDAVRLDQAIKYAIKLKVKAKIHIEVETGMNRTGFTLEQLPPIFNLLHHYQNELQFVGFCTHYAGAESIVNDFRVQKQIEVFNKAKEMLKEHNLKPQYFHSACSAGVMNYPETIGDMVRIGIMQYGFWPNEETLVRFNGRSREGDVTLKRLITWKSEVMTIKNVLKGDYIGYNTSYQAYADMKVAIVPVGYAFGYSRSLSNSGKVLINGQLAPICGIVNMNALCADISQIPDAKKGDEVILIGVQGENTISVSSFGEMSQQLNYELLTRLPQDIPRIIIK